GPAYRTFLRAFWPRVDMITASSPPLIATSPELAPVRDRVELLPFGVDPDEWTQRPALADEIRARYDGPLVLFLGRMRHYKGAPVAVEAMRDAPGTLLMCGDGPERALAEGTAARCGVTDRVRFLGEIG